MPVQILMPALSPTMTEGNLVKWHKKEGDVVKSGQLLAEIETDKATMEVEAVDEGTLGKILVAEGTDNVKVNSVIALLLEDGEDASALETFTPPPSSPATPSLASTETEKESKNIKPENPAPTVSDNSTRVFITPLAKRMAEQGNVPVSTLQGTGPHGRIVKVDVEKALSSKPSPTAIEPALGGYRDVKLTGMRKVIAQRLTESKTTVPHFYLTVDCEIDDLLTLRQHMNAGKVPSKLSVNDFIIRACALSLMDVPEANASWQETALRYYDSADVSVAVAIDGGLVTPVIRRAHLKSVRHISEEMKALAETARAGKLAPEAYQGGTFSLSNLGMFGIKNFSAIINPPQACILAVGAGVKQPVVKNDQLSVATVMGCTLSLDHRAVDGAVGAQFLKVFKEYVENPYSML
jgi:pyruvate dehydrogenase E2 component (dihydrolipoamide acetyltransferase)